MMGKKLPAPVAENGAVAEPVETAALPIFHWGLRVLSWYQPGISHLLFPLFKWRGTLVLASGPDHFRQHKAWFWCRYRGTFGRRIETRGCFRAPTPESSPRRHIEFIEGLIGLHGGNFPQPPRATWMSII